MCKKFAYVWDKIKLQICLKGILLPDPEALERMRSTFERCRISQGARARWSTRRCCSRALRW